DVVAGGGHGEIEEGLEVTVEEVGDLVPLSRDGVIRREVYVEGALLAEDLRPDVVGTRLRAERRCANSCRACEHCYACHAERLCAPHASLFAKSPLTRRSSPILARAHPSLVADFSTRSTSISEAPISIGLFARAGRGSIS